MGFQTQRMGQLKLTQEPYLNIISFKLLSHMAKINSFDDLVDRIIGALGKVENFHLMAEGEHGQKFLKLSVIRQAEIRDFKILFVSHFIPKASQLYVETRNAVMKSKYKNTVHITEDQMKENVYETIRLGYVGMFHKYEAYVTDLIECGELIIEEMSSREISLEDYVFKKFGHQISKEKGKYDFPIIQKLNWICNSIKHCDGCPYPKYKPIEFQHLPADERLKFTKDDFIRDIDMLIDHYLMKMKIVINLAMYKGFFEKERETDFPEKVLEQKNKLDEVLKSLLQRF